MWWKTALERIAILLISVSTGAATGCVAKEAPAISSPTPEGVTVALASPAPDPFGAWYRVAGTALLFACPFAVDVQSDTLPADWGFAKKTGYKKVSRFSFAEVYVVGGFGDPDNKKSAFCHYVDAKGAGDVVVAHLDPEPYQYSGDLEEALFETHFELPPDTSAPSRRYKCTAQPKLFDPGYCAFERHPPAP